MRILPTLDYRGPRDVERDPLEPRFDDVEFAQPPGAPRPPGTSLTLGETLVREGVLEADDIGRILELQERKGLRFGEAALKLRLIKAKDLERALAAQFLHPCIDVHDTRLSRELTALHKPSSLQVELLRQQRSVLMQYWFTSHPALAVVSARHGEGRSYYAANLAVLFAQLGRPTLLVDGDMRRPRQHELFGVENRLGLSQVLAGRVRAAQAAQRIAAIGTLSLLTAGAVPPNPLELLDRGSVPAVLKELARQYSVIIVDTPAGNRYGDARVLANCCRGVLMMLRRHRTRLRDAKRLAALLLRTEVKLVGTVLNRY